MDLAVIHMLTLAAAEFCLFSFVFFSFTVEVQITLILFVSENDEEFILTPRMPMFDFGEEAGTGLQ